MSNPRYHRCAYCRRMAHEAVIAQTIKLPDGKPWAMFSCLNHTRRMHEASDKHLGTNNGVMRSFVSSTGYFEIGHEDEIIGADVDRESVEAGERALAETAAGESEGRP